ncbi:hypothetical protein GCM10009555_081850 [Acrocarpospora macrocephala]|uniref:Uncharacterized protein n=1 Tax=Acrocarpospora macrocephala TaxID=150177 RepID=A0A5M3WR12_9ACTN|nr:hypothetical protein Amac_045230 [Acrocarpospora macrocephala]
MWEDRDWRNVPGPFYGAQTDSCWMGRDIAPRHIVYEDECGSEVVFRQPQSPQEVHLVLTAAWNDPFCAYAGDGDNHWTLELIREWWASRERLAAWIDDVRRRWSVSEREDERRTRWGWATTQAIWTMGSQPTCENTDSGWTTAVHRCRTKNCRNSVSGRPTSGLPDAAGQPENAHTAGRIGTGSSPRRQRVETEGWLGETMASTRL